MEKDYVTVKEICEAYQVSDWTIYQAIHNDPTFPFVNLGKKNYRIHAQKFEEWLLNRTQKQKVQQLKLPTADEMLTT